MCDVTSDFIESLCKSHLKRKASNSAPRSCRILVHQSNKSRILTVSDGRRITRRLEDVETSGGLWAVRAAYIPAELLNVQSCGNKHMRSLYV